MNKHIDIENDESLQSPDDGLRKNLKKKNKLPRRKSPRKGHRPDRFGFSDPDTTPKRKRNKKNKKEKNKEEEEETSKIKKK